MRLFYVRILFSFVMLPLSGQTVPKKQSAQQKTSDVLLWSDEFDTDGAIDDTKWFHQTKLPAGGSWYNGEIQHYTDRLDNTYVSNGILYLVAKKENFTDQGYMKQYTSARLNSKYVLQYGRIAIRAKLPTGIGTWPALWMLGQNITEDGGYWANSHGTTPWPACGEIDIMEHWGTNQNYVQSAMHTPSSFGGTVNHGGQSIPTVSTEFHTYELDWNAERMIFSVDGVVHYTYNPEIKDANTWPYDAPQYFLFNIAIQPSIAASFTEDAMEIDYIRVYEATATEVTPPETATNIHDDFEGNGTITTWAEDACEMDTAFANPYKETMNTSNTVLKYDDTGGAYANIRFDTSANFDLTANNTFSLQVYVPSNGITGTQPNQLSLKLQDGSQGSPWLTQCEIIKPLVLDQWQEIVFDFENDNYINLNENSPDPITRSDFNRVVLQFNSENNADKVVAYIDAFVYDDILSVGKLQTQNIPSFYPNPTKGKLTIEGPMEKVELLSVGGQKILESKTNELDISFLPKGVYLLRVVTSSSAETFRVLKS